MAPKKKGQKIALGDFLADDTMGGSWADEMDAMPTAPAPRDPNADTSSLGGSHLSRGGNRYGDRGAERGGFGDRGDRAGFDSDRPPRVELPVPDRPPYNAFIGNLSFDVSTTDLEAFFGGRSIVTSVRMITDNMTGKPKGYCYVEFAERDGLVAALDKSGRDMGGRSIRVSVAEPPKDRDDRTSGAWRRDGPLPTVDERRKPSSGGFREREYVADEDRGERLGFGSKFVPSNDGPERSGGFRRASERSNSGFTGAGPDEDRGELLGFGSKFVPSPDAAEGHGRRPSGTPSNYSDRAPPQRGSAFVPSHDGPPNSGTSTGSRPGFGDRRASEAPSAADAVGTWRNARPPPSRNGSVSPGDAQPQPPSRRRLELAPRTVSSTSTPAGSGAASPTSVASKSSPFGGARPVDSAERDRAAEDKLEKEREELAVKLEADRKAKADAEEARRAARASAPNPFGAAKPVDTLSKELEVGERLEAERKDRTEKLANAPTSRGPGPTRRPSAMSSSNDGTKSPTVPQSPRSANIDPPQAPNSTNSSQAVKGPKAADSALRKQGLSFAERAKAKANPATSPLVKSSGNSSVDDVTKQVDAVQV